MSITTRTRSKVAAVLQEHALGLGLTVADVRALYPAKQVRRTAVLEALADLEQMGHVAWHGDRVRWVAPLSDVDRAVGTPVVRIERDRAIGPDERILRAARLSAHFLETPP